MSIVQRALQLLEKVKSQQSAAPNSAKGLANAHQHASPSPAGPLLVAHSCSTVPLGEGPDNLAQIAQTAHASTCVLLLLDSSGQRVLWSNRDIETAGLVHPDGTCEPVLQQPTPGDVQQPDAALPSSFLTELLGDQATAVQALQAVASHLTWSGTVRSLMADELVELQYEYTHFGNEQCFTARQASVFPSTATQLQSQQHSTASRKRRAPISWLCGCSRGAVTAVSLSFTDTLEDRLGGVGQAPTLAQREASACSPAQRQPSTQPLPTIQPQHTTSLTAVQEDRSHRPDKTAAEQSSATPDLAPAVIAPAEPEAAPARGRVRLGSAVGSKSQKVRWAEEVTDTPAGTDSATESAARDGPGTGMHRLPRSLRRCTSEATDASSAHTDDPGTDCDRPSTATCPDRLAARSQCGSEIFSDQPLPIISSPGNETVLSAQRRQRLARARCASFAVPGGTPVSALRRTARFGSAAPVAARVSDDVQVEGRSGSFQKLRMGPDAHDMDGTPSIQSLAPQLGPRTATMLHSLLGNAALESPVHSNKALPTTAGPVEQPHSPLLLQRSNTPQLMQARTDSGTPEPGSEAEVNHAGLGTTHGALQRTTSPTLGVTSQQPAEPSGGGGDGAAGSRDASVGSALAMRPTADADISVWATVQPCVGTPSSTTTVEFNALPLSARYAAEVTVRLLTQDTPGGGSRQLLLVVLQDISEKAVLDALLGQLVESQLSMVSQMFPYHVIQHLSRNTEQKGAASGHVSALTTNTSWALDTGMQQPPAPSSPSGVLRNAVAQKHIDVTVLFMDIVGFTTMSKEVEPYQVMAYLNELFSHFDELVTVHGVHKVETAGDCYIVSAGVLEAGADGFLHVTKDHDPSISAARVMAFAKDMLQFSSSVVMPHNSQATQIRIGMHTGTCMSGLVGSRLPKFSIYGDSINTASRMESTCVPGRIQVSEATRQLLTQETWEATGGVNVKGKGTMMTYLWIPPPEPQPAPDTADASRASPARARGTHSSLGTTPCLPSLQACTGPLRSGRTSGAVSPALSNVSSHHAAAAAAIAAVAAEASGLSQDASGVRRLLHTASLLSSQRRNVIHEEDDSHEHSAWGGTGTDADAQVLSTSGIALRVTGTKIPTEESPVLPRTSRQRSNPHLASYTTIMTETVGATVPSTGWVSRQAANPQVSVVANLQTLMMIRQHQSQQNAILAANSSASVGVPRGPRLPGALAAYASVSGPRNRRASAVTTPSAAPLRVVPSGPFKRGTSVSNCFAEDHQMSGLHRVGSTGRRESGLQPEEESALMLTTHADSDAVNEMQAREAKEVRWLLETDPGSQGRSAARKGESSPDRLSPLDRLINNLDRQEYRHQGSWNFEI